MENKSIIFSIVILSWNRKNDIIATLEDLAAQNLERTEILIIDQASTDGVCEEIEMKFQECRILRLPKNMGVPGGRNVGAANSKGKYVIFLDNDAYLKPGFLTSIEEEFLQDQKLGIIGFKIQNYNSGELDYDSWAYQKSMIKNFNSRFYSYTYCGCGHVIKKELFDKVGYYWDDLFFSWEESEFSFRVLDRGYKILYLPEIVVLHRTANECRTTNPLHECLRLRNSLWVNWRYLPFLDAVQDSIIRVPVYIIKSIKKKCFFRMICFFVLSLSKIYLIFDAKHKISLGTLKEYRKLSYRGSLWQQLKYLFSNP